MLTDNKRFPFLLGNEKVEMLFVSPTQIKISLCPAVEKVYKLCTRSLVYRKVYTHFNRCTRRCYILQGLYDLKLPVTTKLRLVGLVVNASTSRAEDPGFESRLRRDFSGVESYQRLKNWHSSGYPARRLAL